MALSARELLLVLRARDEASRVLRGLAGEFGNVSAAAMTAARNQISAGSGLVSLGVGFSAVGIAGLQWMEGSIKEAVEFNRTIAQIHTQLDKVKASEQELGDIVKRTAAEIPVPIEQMSKALYDIFSSMDVSVPQSEMLLKSFSKEAVAGQVDLQAAARATIGVLNAFHLKAEEVTRVQDVQFQLVRKGVGTYEEFSAVIGRATPSAARAGQTVETLAGMLAYLTRNGLSAAMASASAGRAFDAFANPKVVGRLEKMGVVVKDASGNFRPLADVMVDLQGKLANLTAPERAQALDSLFKGAGGTIQARRFYDAVLKDRTSVMQFAGLVGDMNNAQGAFGQAYETMANTTASKSQLLTNKWQLMRIEVGEALIPVFESLIGWLSKVLDFWNSLDSGTKKQVIVWVAIGFAILTVVGILIVAAGAIMMLGGAAAALGIGLGVLLGIFGLVILGIAAVIAIGILLAKNWDSISKVLSSVWNGFLSVLKAVWSWIETNIGGKLGPLWKRVSDDIITAVRSVGEWVHRIWDDIVTWTRDRWSSIQRLIQPVIDWLVAIWPNVSDIIRDVLRILVDTFSGAWTAISGVVKGAWTIISGVVEGIIHILEGIIDFIVGVLTLNWTQAWNGIKEIFGGVWQIISSIVKGAWEAISGIIKGALQVVWSLITNGLDIVKNVFLAFGKSVKAIWDEVWGWASKIGKGIADAVVDAAKGVWKFFEDLPGKIGGFFTGAGKWLWEHGRNIINGLIDGMWAGLTAPRNMDLFASMSAWIGQHKGPIEKDRKLLIPAGHAIMQGLITGMQDEMPALAAYLQSVSTQVAGTNIGAPMVGGATFGEPSQGYGQYANERGNTNNTYNQYITVHTQQIDPRREAAELGHELFRGL